MFQFSAKKRTNEDKIRSFIEKREKVPKSECSYLYVYPESMQRLQTMCTVMVLAWLMSWTPYLIVFLLPQLGLGHLLTPNVGKSL